MSKHVNTETVTIADEDYRVACHPEKRDALLKAARYLDSQMRTIHQQGKVTGLDRIAVMAALNISHELLYYKDDVNEQIQQLTHQSAQALCQLRSTPKEADP